jgi:hypothetical protein
MKRKSACACGQVSAVVEGDPLKVTMCHCDYCQQRSGSVFQVSAWYPRDRVLELSGETKSFSGSPNSLGIEYEFCPNCGSTVHWTFDALDQAFPGMGQIQAFAVGCFADKDFPAPELEFQTQYKHCWLAPFAGVESFEEAPSPTVLLADL